MLKGKITKDEHAALPEVVQAHYKVEGDGYVLDADGLVSKADLSEVNRKLVEFREHNKALEERARELTALKEKYKDVDPAEHTRLKGELEELQKKGVRKPDDVTTKIQEAVKPLIDKLAEADRLRSESDTALQQSRLRSALTQAAIEGKVIKKAVPVVVGHAMKVFEMDANDNLKATDGHYSPDKPSESITINEWMTAQAKGDLDYAFEKSQGGGAGDPGGGHQTSTAKKIDSRDPMELGRNLEDLASGKSELA